MRPFNVVHSFVNYGSLQVPLFKVRLFWCTQLHGSNSGPNSHQNIHRHMFVKRQLPIEDDTQNLHVLSHWKSQKPPTDTDDIQMSLPHRADSQTADDQSLRLVWVELHAVLQVPLPDVVGTRGKNRQSCICIVILMARWSCTSSAYWWQRTTCICDYITHRSAVTTNNTGPSTDP